MKGAENRYDLDSDFWKAFRELPGSPYRSSEDLSGLRCLLVHLTRPGDYSRNEYPLSLGQMASILRMNQAQVTIRIEDAPEFRSDDYAGYDVIAFYPMVTLLPRLLLSIEEIRRTLPSARIVLFNSEQHQHENLLGVPAAPDFARELVEANPGIDAILLGEAEASFLALCEEVATRRFDLSRVPACVFRADDGSVARSSAPAPPIDFRTLPFPARDRLEAGILEGGRNRLSARIQGSRGCLARCAYCVEGTSNRAGALSKPWAGRSRDVFLDEIELLSRRFGVCFFNVIDSSFEDPGRGGIRRMVGFSEGVIQRGIEASFKIHLRGETVLKLESDQLATMKQAGIDVVIIGAESGLTSELASYQKIASAEQTREAVARMDAAGPFFTLLGHIMFSPILELEQLGAKLDYLRSLGRTWDYLNLANNVLVYRGTTYHATLERLGLAEPVKWGDALVGYRYRDDRVARVAEGMGALKRLCPEVSALQNLVYDTFNVHARFHNPMNSALREREGAFEDWWATACEARARLGSAFEAYFTDLVDEAGGGGRAEAASLAAEVKTLLHDQRECFTVFRGDLEGHGLDTTGLFLQTWLSLINTEVNSARGRIR